MNKTEFLDKFIEKNERDLPKHKDGKVNRAATMRLLDSILDLTAESLSNGESVQFTGFGTFTTYTRAEKKGYNPSTGEPMIIPAVKVPKFKASYMLKDAVAYGSYGKK